MNDVNYFVLCGNRVGFYNYFKNEIGFHTENVFNVEPQDDIDTYVKLFSEKKIKISNQEDLALKNNDVIVLDSELLLDESSKHLDYKGIELLKYFRIKLNLLNPIIIVGIDNPATILREHPEHYIFFAPSNYYIELPLNDVELYDLLEIKKIEQYPIENIDKLKSLYKPFVQADFNALDIGHSLANEFGLYLMQKASEQVLNVKFNIKEKVSENFLFDKAKFLYNYHLSSDKGLKKMRDDALSKFIKQKKVICIDDQGGNDKTTGWFHWFKKTLNIYDNCYKKLTPTILGSQIDTEETFKEIQTAFNNKPDLILLDLRLLGDKEKNIPIENVSGAHLLKKIKEWDASIPVIIVSATDRLKSLAVLQNFPYCADGFWGKPRIEKGDLDLNESLFKLLSLIRKELTKYKFNVQKYFKQVDYSIQGLEHSINEYDFTYYKQFDYIFFDTNFFSEKTKDLQKNQKHLFLLINALKDKVVILDDVWSELFINSLVNKDSKTKLASKYTLNRLLKYKNEGRFLDLHKEESNIKSSQIEPQKESIKGTNFFKIKLTQTIDRHFCVNEKIANEKFANLEKDIKEKNLKSLIHADDVLRQLTFQLVKSGKKVLIISKDVDCKREIALELRNARLTGFSDSFLNKKLFKVYNPTTNKEKVTKNELVHLFKTNSEEISCVLLPNHNLKLKKYK